MNKKIVGLLLFIAFSFAACSSGEEESDGTIKIVLDKDYVVLGVGKTAMVKVLIGNDGYVVTSESASTAVATIDNKEITITGIAVGDTNIQVKDKEHKTASIKVVVTADAS